MKNSFLLLAMVYGLIATPAFAAKDSSKVTITFTNTIGSQKLALGKPFTNSFDEPFTVTRFKYYVSNFTFYHTNGMKTTVMPSYFLVNEEDSASKSMTVSVKSGSYNTLSFLIGVDSTKNVSGTQTDALDPMNGMFWTWNSGYINAKLEGTSPLSKAPNNLIEYHIGGFRSNQNTVRRVTFSFPAATTIGLGKELTIAIIADINQWFKGRHDLKIADHTACMTPGKLSVEYADNYEKMFSIASINSSEKQADQ